MKIDYISIGYWPIVGGTEAIVRNVAERMARRGHDVTVHTSAYNPNYDGELKKSEIYNGVKIQRYRLFPFYTFLPKIISPEIIHLFSYGDNFIIQSILHGSKLLVSSPIGEEVYAQHKTRNRFFGRYILDKSKKIFAMTSHEKSEINRVYGINSSKVFVWPGGVGDEAFALINLKDVSENLQGIASKKYYIRLSRIDRVKNLEFGIQLLPYFEDLIYVVAGSFDDQKYLSELRDLSKKLRVNDRVIFTGRVEGDEKNFLLRNSLFYLIANHETFGIASLEAMAQGVPIVVPNLNEYTDIASDRVNSLIYEYNSIESCVESIKFLMHDEHLRQELGKNGKTIVRENFHWEHITDEAEKIYYELINNRK